MSSTDDKRWPDAEILTTNRKLTNSAIGEDVFSSHLLILVVIVAAIGRCRGQPVRKPVTLATLTVEVDGYLLQWYSMSVVSPSAAPST
jgi:hypothetical protein